MARTMKDSGVNWIRQIPSGWNVANLRHNFTFGKGLPITKENLRENGIAVISYGQIHSKSNSGTTITRELIRYVDSEYLLTNPDSLVHEDDFIFADTSEDLAGCGNFVYVDKEKQLFAGYHTIILRHKADYAQKYYAFLFLSDAWRSQIRERVTGVKLFSISQKILRETSILIPPLAEQSRIAAFLDEKCAAIDAVIEQTRASIEEYKKLKQAVITQAVTKGLRPGRRMKESGIEWIGEIPEEYSIIKLKHILCSPLQYGANQSGVPYGESLPRYIRITDITLDGKLKKTGVLSLSEGDSEGYILQNNDVLFARSGATVGKTFIYKAEYGRSAFAGYLIRASLNKEFLPDLLFFYTQSSIYEEWKNQIFIQSTIQNIGADRYNELLLILPPIEEQQEIVDYLDKKIAEIDSLIDRKAQLLCELENYKKSLIFEYVTGKKEVNLYE